MHEIEETSVPEAAMPDVRIDDTIRSELDTQHQHLGLSITTNVPSESIDPPSPATSTDYQPTASSPARSTFSPKARSKRQTRHYPNMSTVPGSKRSSSYFGDTPTDNLYKNRKRRRRDQESDDRNPTPSAAALQAAESLRRGGAGPRPFRCRSRSLPDITTLTKMARGDIDPKPSAIPTQYSRFPSALLLLPSLSSEAGATSSSNNRCRFRNRDQPIPPPITRNSLRELETPEILKNAQLIHDIIHDPSLQFRPNLEGPRGERKRLAAEQYWSALEREVDRLKICLRKDPNGLVKLSSNRFPVLFSELRDILCSMLPLPDRLVVEEVIDPEFLCQQVFRGVLNVENLACFLGKMMKEHCAPMRDVLVEKMVRQFQFAEMSGSTSAFVLGLRMVFELLEGMKLVCNSARRP